VVDDDLFLRTFLGRLLPILGFGVTAVASGEEAARLLAAGSTAFDLALIDVDMPGLDGPATARLLRRVKPGLVCCLMSGSPPDDGPGLADGSAIAFVPMPFAPKLLGDALRTALAEAHELASG